MDEKRKIRISRLQTAGDVTSELGRLYRAGRREEIPAVNAYRLSLILKTLLDAIESNEFERRLTQLEATKDGE